MLSGCDVLQCTSALCFLIFYLTISYDYYLALFRSVLTTEYLKFVKWAMVHSLNLTDLEEFRKTHRLQMLSLRQEKEAARNYYMCHGTIRDCQSPKKGKRMSGVQCL